MASPPALADPVVVAAGDISCDPGNANFNGGFGTFAPAPGQCHEKYTSDLFPSLAPAAVLALGDLQYEDGALTKFQASYDAKDASSNPISWGRAKSITRPVPGNHEYGAGTSSGGNIHDDPNATGYFTYFSDVLSQRGSTATDPKKGYYSFNVAAGSTHWHFVALNSECVAGLAATVGWSGGCAAGSAQEQWLRADLAADHSDCTVAYWHHPLFSSGDHGNYPGMRPIWDALYADYADIVLNGHDHEYERFAPQDPGAAAAPGRGIREWVVGTGGRSQLGPGSIKPNSEVRSNAAFGVLRLTLHGASAAHPHGWYGWVFMNDGRSGSTFSDSGSGDCVSPPSTPTASHAAVQRSAPRRHRIAARVYHVLEGDVLKARATHGSRRRYTVRLLGIDAPNRRGRECGSGRARRSLKRLSFRHRRGRRVTLITDPTQPLRDRRGRLIAYVKRRDGTNLALVQLRRGWARLLPTRRPFELLSRFRRPQRRARAARRGAWRLCGGNFHRSP
jgi:endonuclease YncB( thermonuclease family)